MIIKSVTHLKKKLRVGDQVITTFHLKSAGHSFESGVNLYKDEQRPARTVVECNTTGFTLATKDLFGEWHGRRVNYPKASQCCIEDGKLIIMGEDFDNPSNTQPIKWLTIQVLQREEE